MGQTDANNDLGVFYFTGKNVVKDKEKGKKFLEKAVELENYNAMNNLGLIYLNHQPKDVQKAIELFEKAVELGSSYAMVISLFYFCSFFF